MIPFQFSEESGEGRERENIDTLVEKTRRHHIYQIAGPHGSGKSTLLLTLMNRYKDNGENVRHFVFNDQHREIPGDLTSQADQTFFIDGIEKLSYWKVFRLVTRLQRVIMTVHCPLSVLPVIYHTQPQFSTFVRIVRQLAPEMAEETILREVYDRSGGNFRTAFFELYDFWEFLVTRWRSDA